MSIGMSVSVIVIMSLISESSEYISVSENMNMTEY